MYAGMRCNPEKRRGLGNCLVELWAADESNLPATANALVQKFRLIRKDIGGAQTELACSGVFFDTPPPNLTRRSIARIDLTRETGKECV